MEAADIHERRQTETFRFVLRRETRSEHEALDAHPAFAALMNGTLSIGGYGRLMQRFHSFYASHDTELADACRRHRIDRLGFAYAPRRNILARDVAALGGDDAGRQTETLSVLPSIDSDAALGGMLYVFEGSMLGGAVLCRAAEALLARNGASGGHGYWQWCREAGAARWAMTCAMLDGLATSDNARSGMIYGARSAFAGFGNWFAGCHDNPLPEACFVGRERC